MSWIVWFRFVCFFHGARGEETGSDRFPRSCEVDRHASLRPTNDKSDGVHNLWLCVLHCMTWGQRSLLLRLHFLNFFSQLSVCCGSRFVHFRECFQGCEKRSWNQFRIILPSVRITERDIHSNSAFTARGKRKKKKSFYTRKRRKENFWNFKFQIYPRKLFFVVSLRWRRRI